MTDIIVDNLEHLDFSEFTIPIVAIYESPLDYPSFFIARIYDLDKPTNVIMKAKSLDEIRGKKPDHMVIFLKGTQDPSHLVESWI